MPVVIPPGTALAGVEVENEVTYNIGGVVYAGKIRAITPDDLRPIGIGLDIDCQDFTSLFNDEICAASRSVVETDAQRISWLLQSFDRRGITAYHVQTLYSAMPPQDFLGVTLADAIKAVLAYSGGSFYIDFGKDLHTFVSESTLAPFALSDSPDGITSFGYADFQYPRDSPDLRNAVFAIGGGAAPTSADSLAEDITYAGSVFSAVGILAEITPAEGDYIRLRAAGPVTVGAQTSVTPSFVFATQAGNLGIAIVSSPTTKAATTTAGWQEVVFGDEQADFMAVWVKPNCNPGETPPTFTCGGAGGKMIAQLLEFAGADTVVPVGPTGILGTSSSNITGASAQAPASATRLLLGAVQWTIGAGLGATVVDAMNNGLAPMQAGFVQATAAGPWDRVFNVVYALAGVRPKWYTDEASIAIYGRREAAFKDTNVTTQADLDALGAAYLAGHANPLRHASCMVDRVGLAAGQIVPVTNALHGLSAQPFRIQNVETTYSENVPRFKVEFADPAITLATQMQGLQDQISARSASTTPDTLGTLGYAEVTATQGTFTAVTDITDLVLTVAVAAGRRIRVTCQIGGSSSIAGDLIGAYIREGTSTLQQDQFAAPLAATAFMSNFDVDLRPSAGSHTYKISMARVIGTGNITMQAGATFPASITVEDIGT